MDLSFDPVADHFQRFDLDLGPVIARYFRRAQVFNRLAYLHRPICVLVSLQIFELHILAFLSHGDAKPFGTHFVRQPERESSNTWLGLAVLILVFKFLLDSAFSFVCRDRRGKTFVYFDDEPICLAVVDGLHLELETSLVDQVEDGHLHPAGREHILNLLSCREKHFSLERNDTLLICCKSIGSSLVLSFAFFCEPSLKWKSSGFRKELLKVARPLVGKAFAHKEEPVHATVLLERLDFFLAVV